MRRVAAVIAVFATAGFAAAPACAQGFTDYRQAAAAEYNVPSGTQPSNPPTTPVQSTGASSNPTTTTVGPKGAQHKARPHRTSHPSSGTAHRPGNRTGLLGARNGLPVAVSGPSQHVPSSHGQLPFTGGPLGVVVLIALLMLATGFLLAAASRLRRVRRDGSATG